MDQIKKIESALISVFYKDGIDDIAAALTRRGAKLLSTGGTYDYLASKGFQVEKVEEKGGLKSLRNEIEAEGGSLIIRVGQGVSLDARIPVG